MRLLPRLTAFLAFLGLACLAALPARADDAVLCRTAIANAERDRHIPDAFLSAIARVETGRRDPGTGGLAAWPWTINAEGTGAFFATKAEAVAAVRALQARGVRSIDVGCLQVNLMHHPEAFASLEQGFDPQDNANFAAGLLISLFHQTGSWPRAAAAYHSQTPPIGAAYQKLVLAEWAVPDQPDDGATPADLATRKRSRHRQRDAQQASAAVPSIPSAPSILPPRTALPPKASSGSVFAMAQPSSRVIGLGARAASGSVGLPATGRSLAAYRTMPTLLAFNLPPRPR